MDRLINGLEYKSRTGFLNLCTHDLLGCMAVIRCNVGRLPQMWPLTNMYQYHFQGRQSKHLQTLPNVPLGTKLTLVETIDIKINPNILDYLVFEKVAFQVYGEKMGI